MVHLLPLALSGTFYRLGVTPTGQGVRENEKEIVELLRSLTGLEDGKKLSLKLRSFLPCWNPRQD